MKRINHASSGTNLIGLLLSISIGLAVILFSPGRTNAHSTEKVPVDSAISNRIRVQQIYTSQIGVREKQVNSGPEVEKYLRYVNLSKGNPWCAAFVCWVFGKAGVINPRTGWSPDLFKDAKVIWQRGERGNPIAIGLKGERFSGVKHPTSDNRHAQTSDFRPQTSDVFGLYFPEKARIAHVGFIDKWDGTWMISVEGNTNVAGSREGDGVYRKRRLIRSIYKVARYISPN